MNFNFGTIDAIDSYIDHPNMVYYRSMYRNSKKWDGKEDISGKKIIVYGCQGHGDQIMFLRFIRFLKAMDCQVVVHTPKALHRIVETLGVAVIDRDLTPLPDHDYHILSFSLPFLLKVPIPLEPFIIVPEKTELLPGTNIGIAWEGSHLHEYNENRNCPLKHFKTLQREGLNLWCLQKNICDQKLVAGAEDMVLNGTEIEDFYDVAKMMNSLDAVVSVDTAVLHLAGAMGIKGYGLLSHKTTDPRWNLGPWYTTIKLLKGSWEESFKKINL
jgi:hypothetical protein